MLLPVVLALNKHCISMSSSLLCPSFITLATLAMLHNSISITQANSVLYMTYVLAVTVAVRPVLPDACPA